MKQFEIPTFYKSALISRIKKVRNANDRLKRDLSPTCLDFGPVRFLIARHFGFCYGVENAIEISYRAVEENLGKRVFLLSQMIHNQVVNDDLLDRGVRFIMDNGGNQFVRWDEIHADDIVIVPAFGTSLEIEAILEERGVEVKKYNTTCPFVEKVWKRSKKMGEDGFTVLIHGKHSHEETRATFSHAHSKAPTLVLKNLEEAQVLGDFILRKRPVEEVEALFSTRMSEGFEFKNDLRKIGVVNQTTMLASETQKISKHLSHVMKVKYGEKFKEHFADTRDTLCYATNDNQSATYALLEHPADVAIVVGGYNSSNTSHIVELCEAKLPTYFVNLKSEIESLEKIHHFNWEKQERVCTRNWLDLSSTPVNIILTSGASCPDALVEEVVGKILDFFPESRPIEVVIEAFENESH